MLRAVRQVRKDRTYPLLSSVQFSSVSRRSTARTTAGAFWLLEGFGPLIDELRKDTCQPDTSTPHKAAISEKAEQTRRMELEEAQRVVKRVASASPVNECSLLEAVARRDTARRTHEERLRALLPFLLESHACETSDGLRTRAGEAATDAAAVANALQEARRTAPRHQCTEASHMRNRWP